MGVNSAEILAKRDVYYRQLPSNADLPGADCLSNGLGAVYAAEFRCSRLEVAGNGILAETQDPADFPA